MTQASRSRPSGLRRLALVSLVAIGLVACAATPAPSASGDALGVVFVQPGEMVQAAPPTEELKVILSEALWMTESNGDDLGYPWFDPATGEIVLSVVTAKGQELIDAAGITAPYRVRSVAPSAAALQRIQDDATMLLALGVPGAELIVATAPDWRDNRAMIVISAPSQRLLDALTERYPADALAVQVDPALAA